jgi:phage FluMu protein Com
MLIPVHCQFCGKITAYVEDKAVLHANSPAVKQAKGTLWTIQATCPKCDDSQHQEVQSNPFEGQGIFELLNILGVKK